jgi:hypothetical protein
MGNAFLFGMMFAGMAFVLTAMAWIAYDARKNRKFVRQAETDRAELLSIIDDAELMVSELNNFSDYIFSRIDQKNSEAEDCILRLGRELGAASEAYSALAGQAAQAAQVALPAAGWAALPPAGAAYAQPAGDGDGAGEGLALALAEAGGGADSAEALDVAELAEGEAAEPAGMDGGAELAETGGGAALAETGGDWEPEAEAPPAMPPIIMFPMPEDIERHRAKRKIRANRSKKLAEVLRCAEDGLSESEIAQRLDIGRGEVSLILGLKDVYEEH